MKITFNEAAHVHKMASLEDAANVYKQFIDTHMALEEDKRITNKIEFCGKLVDISIPITTNGSTVYDLQKIWGSMGRERYRKLLTIFSRLASTQRTPVPNKEFTLDGIEFLIPKDDINSMLISLATLPHYESSCLTGSVENGKKLEMKNISNPTQIEKEHRIILGIRLYEKNDKHKPIYTYMENGEQSSPMDLRDEEAQELLNCAKCIGEEKLLYAAKNGKCYAFREHEIGKAVYHGYLVENPSEKVKRMLGLR